MRYRIAVIDKGRLVDTGTHEELLARCRLYRLLLAGPGTSIEHRFTLSHLGDHFPDFFEELRRRET